MPETYGAECPIDLTIMLPAYNEEEAIESVIHEIRETMCDWPASWEILVVDDASRDHTRELAEAAGVRVVRHPQNRGAGGACKTGLVAARGDLFAMIDADGSYPVSALPELLAFLPTYDQVNGARTSEKGTLKPLRVPAKWLVRKLAEWISGKRIPDLNTGMKVFKRQIMLRYLWVIPEGFSNVTSMTLAFLTNGHPVKYVPVEYRKRIGNSKFHPIKDTFHYAATVFRMITYFRPLRIFFPLSAAIGLVALASACYNTFFSPLGLHDSDIILTVTAILVLVAGMIADLIVAQRRNLGEMLVPRDDFRARETSLAEESTPADKSS